MSSALWIATTGLSASARQLDVIGHNIANSNTIGFKASDTHFSTMLSASLLGTGRANIQMGHGVGVAAVATQFQQGSFESTGNATDMAIDGNGFFVVRDADNVLYFTRTGNFRLQKDGFLADGSNFRVQGRTYEDGIIESPAIGDLNLRDVQVSPNATTVFSFGGTLNHETPPGQTFNVQLTAFDSLGGSHQLELILTKAAHPGYWDVKSRLAGVPSLSQTHGGIMFDQTGSIARTLEPSIVSAAAVVSPSGGTASLPIVLTPGVLGRSTPIASPILLTRGATPGEWTVTNHGGYSNMGIHRAESALLELDLKGAGKPDLRFDLSGAWAAGDTLSFGISTPEYAVTDINFAFGPLPNGAVIGTAGSLRWQLTGPDAPTLLGFADESRITSRVVDGFPPGTLTGLNIDQTGTITGLFSNGQQQRIARVVLGDFRSPHGLRKQGNYFLESLESGAWLEGRAASAGFGAINPNSLEISNTDLAREFVKMISAQRKYQANARIITAADQMQQELMNIRR